MSHLTRVHGTVFTYEETEALGMKEVTKVTGPGVRDSVCMLPSRVLLTQVPWAKGREGTEKEQRQQKLAPQHSSHHEPPAVPGGVS